MVATYFPFDSGAGANVTEASWTKMARQWIPTGPLDDELNELATYADSTGMQVKVPSGRAWMRGHFFESDAEVILAIAAADPTNPRIDRVIVRLNWTANTIALAVLTGTPAGSPSAPALTQTTSTWEISLAQVAVAAAAVTIAAGNITDERTLVQASTHEANAVNPHNRLHIGSGSPEGVRTAPVGSIYLRSDGARGTTIYTKVSGTGNTGWETLGSMENPPTIATDSPPPWGPAQGTSTATGASGTWNANNEALYVPIVLTYQASAKRFFWFNGAAVSGNVDVGIYDSAWARKISTGSTVQSGTTAAQIVDVADTALAAAQHYLALVASTTVAAFRCTVKPGDIHLLRALGFARQGTALPLPATATPVALDVDKNVPVFGVELGNVY